MSVTGGITLLDNNTFLRSNAAARGEMKQEPALQQVWLSRMTC